MATDTVKLQGELQDTLIKLKSATHPEVRVTLLREMRILLHEAETSEVARCRQPRF
jgi:hypothetical protein